METKIFNPAIGALLLPSCVYATTYAKRNNCIVVMIWGNMKHTCNNKMTAAQFYSLVNFNIKNNS